MVWAYKRPTFGHSTVKELERFNWWLIYNLISNSVGNLMISVLRANL